MAKNQSLAEFFASKGMRLRTWARANGLSENDMALIYEISYGNTQGLRGRAKEIKELLEKEGFAKPLAKSVKSFSKCAVRGVDTLAKDNEKLGVDTMDTSPKAQYDKRNQYDKDFVQGKKRLQHYEI